MKSTPTIERLTKRSQFLRARAGVRASRTHVMVEAVRREPGGPIGLGFTATRKIGGAVVRNRAKRRLREAARQLIGEFGLGGVDYVLVARQSTSDAPWPALLDDLRSALIRLAAKLTSSAEPERATPRPAQKRPPTSGSD